MHLSIITKIENKQACLPARRFALGGGLEEPFCKQAVVGVIPKGHEVMPWQNALPMDLCLMVAYEKPERPCPMVVGRFGLKLGRS